MGEMTDLLLLLLLLSVLPPSVLLSMDRFFYIYAPRTFFSSRPREDRRRICSPIHRSVTFNFPTYTEAAIYFFLRFNLPYAAAAAAINHASLRSLYDRAIAFLSCIRIYIVYTCDMRAEKWNYLFGSFII